MAGGIPPRPQRRKHPIIMNMQNVTGTAPAARSAVPATSAAPFIICAPDVRRRTAEPIPRWETLDGASVVSLPLVGPRAAGRSVILDADDFRHVAETWGIRWSLSGTNGDYVSSTRVRAGRAAHQRSPVYPKAYLARLILDARPKEMILYGNGTLDLRRHNLTLLGSGLIW